MRYHDFIKRFPNANAGLIPWNKGKTKETHPSLLRLSAGLKAKNKWNFSKWQRKQPKIQYKRLIKNRCLAELIGIILGDGSLYKHARTENLRVICNSRDIAYIRHIAILIEKVFHKKPAVTKRENENATVVCLYQCEISKRLNLPCGNKIKNDVGIPSWIFPSKSYMRSCLKGLFETDGCFHEDTDNYTRIIELKSNGARLRKGTYNILLRLGFNPQMGKNYVRLARKDEVYKFKDWIDFRNYN